MLDHDMIKAEVIAHSKYDNTELISIEIEAPKFIDAELEKHRMISSNSSSDRAIPFSKMLAKRPFIPIDFRMNERGMQGYKSLGDVDSNLLTEDILKAYTSTCELLDPYEHVHKQHLNRYLLPFSIQKKIMTATRFEWDYFLNLRMDKYADPVVQDLAKKIKLVICQSNGTNLSPYEWHLPYVVDSDYDLVSEIELLKLSAARCARVSYNNPNETTVVDDLTLFKRLAGSEPRHMSPLDHQGKPIDYEDLRTTENNDYFPVGATRINRDFTYGSGNFDSWIQFRHYYRATLGESYGF